MNISAVLVMVIPAVAFGIIIASTVFASILRRSERLRTSLACGSNSARDLLYDYIAEEERQTVHKAKKATRKKSAQFYSFDRERRLRAN